MFHVKHRPVDLLERRCAELGVALPAGVPERLIALLEAIAREPQNLTTITDVAAGVDRHLADSVAVAALPGVLDERARIVDVGSGAGFPGLALAAILADTTVTLIESERRKAEWLARAAEAFPNVRVVNVRAEDVARQEPGNWQIATARALAPLPVALELCAPLVGADGRVVVWRGRRDEDEEERGEQAAALLGLSPAQIHQVTPFPGAERHIAVYTRVAPNPDRFPRRSGMAAHRPLA